MPTQPTQPQAPTPNVGGFITAARAKGVPDTQIYSYLQSKGVIKPAQAASPTSKNSSVGDYFKSVGDTFNQGINQAADAENDIGSGQTNGDNPIVHGLKEGLHLESGIATAVASPVAPLMKPIGDAMQAYGNWATSDKNPFNVGGEKQSIAFANSPVGQEVSNVAQPVADAGNVAGTILGVDQAVKAPAQISNLAQQGVDVAKNTAQKIKSNITPNPEEVAAKTQSKTQVAVNSAATDWQKPTTINKPGYAKPKAILANSPDTPKFLAEQGLNPSAHIEDGKYNTSDTADALRNTAAKMSNDTLRPSLQMADYTTPKTPVTDILKQTQKNIEADKELTAGEKETALSNASREATALQKNHPTGMSLTDMHDSKITYAGKGGYSPIKDPAADVKAASNRAMASAFQKTVEDKAPASVPVKPFNQYLSKYFKGADYLDSLNGKNAPVSLGQQIARGAAKFGGAAVGAKFGGGVVSEFAGYQIGKALEHAAENLTNPMRASYLRNLEVTNPEAFTRVKAYLDKQSSGNTGTPRLNAPTSTQLPPPSEASMQRGRALQIPKEQGEIPKSMNTLPKELAPLAAEAKTVTAYHGSNAKFDNFDFKKTGLTSGEKPLHGLEGAWFVDNKAVANSYGKNIKEARIDTSNFHTIDAKGKTLNDFRDELWDAKKLVKDQGKDGLIVKNLIDNADYSKNDIGNHIFVVNKNSIKSSRVKGNK